MMTAEQQIINCLRDTGKWMTQREIRKATGMPMSRVENFTLSLALEDRIDRKLTPDHRTQLFRVRLADAAAQAEETGEPQIVEL